MFEKDIRDSKDRIYDNCFMYYGRELKSEVSEYEIRNHIWKARNRTTSDIPKQGCYVMPEELFGKVLPYDYSTKINSKFRNVQYIEHEDYLYWIYCFSSMNLYGFKFIGDNVSDEMVRALMQSAGFILGFKHRRESASMFASDRWVEVWFHPEKLHVALIDIDVEIHPDRPMIHDKRVFLKKFESYQVEEISNTSAIFKRREKFITVPFTIKYPENYEFLYWTKYIKPKDGWFCMNPERELTEDDIKRDCEYYMQSDYDDMLKLIFNKES